MKGRPRYTLLDEYNELYAYIQSKLNDEDGNVLDELLELEREITLIEGM